MSEVYLPSHGFVYILFILLSLSLFCLGSRYNTPWVEYWSCCLPEGRKSLVPLIKASDEIARDLGDEKGGYSSFLRGRIQRRIVDFQVCHCFDYLYGLLYVVQSEGHPQLSQLFVP